jgi:hypothetical protein
MRIYVHRYTVDQQTGDSVNISLNGQCHKKFERDRPIISVIASFSEIYNTVQYPLGGGDGFLKSPLQKRGS